MEKNFPESFYWGAATASYQVEGGIDNTDWAAAAEAGRVPVCGVACDHYHRYEADFDLAQSLGHTAHRLSIEWARIEPREGEFDHEAVAHYRQVLTALLARDITPFVTIWHFTLPQWFAESGGFERQDSPQIFARYAKFVADQLGDLCNEFTTINEPGVYATHAYLYGSRPPFKAVKILGIKVGKDYGHKQTQRNLRFGNLFTFLRVKQNLVRAHNAAYDVIKAGAPHLRVSLAKHVRYYGSNWNPINKLLAAVAEYLQSGWFLWRVNDKIDLIGLNYYRSTHFGETVDYEMTDIGWKVTPWEICDALVYLGRFKKPIVVMEAGLADQHDKDRARYIEHTVKGIGRALRAGVDVQGFMYWSLLDNYEWDDGFGMRFGLIEIDYDTLERRIRPSAYVYKEIIERNGVVE
jgi:beta-glucosidase